MSSPTAETNLETWEEQYYLEFEAIKYGPAKSLLCSRSRFDAGGVDERVVVFDVHVHHLAVRSEEVFDVVLRRRLGEIADVEITRRAPVRTRAAAAGLAYLLGRVRKWVVCFCKEHGNLPGVPWSALCRRVRRWKQKQCKL